MVHTKNSSWRDSLGKIVELLISEIRHRGVQTTFALAHFSQTVHRTRTGYIKIFLLERKPGNVIQFYFEK
jgi:hypothetical protein